MNAERAVRSFDLLGLWEAAAARGPLARAVFLAGQLSDQTDPWHLPLPDRDRLLLALRRRLFGNEITIWRRCPNCGETLEAEIDLAALPGADGSGASHVAVAIADGSDVELRLPTSADLRDAGAVSSAPNVQRRELARRLLAVDPGNEDIAAIEDALADADPFLEINFAFTCPACEMPFSATFDIAAALWAEIDNLTRHLLQDVHDLARTYHWPEADILALTPQRRDAYLQLVRS